MHQPNPGRRGAVALLALLLAGPAVSGPVGETSPDPAPAPVAPPVVPVESGMRLESRLGEVFPTVFLRPPVEEFNPLMRTGSAPEGGLPVAFAMGRVTPNPVVGRARIGFDLPVPTRMRLEVIDIAGRVVSTLADGLVPAGRHSREWSGRDTDGKSLAPGVYFLRMDARAVNGADGLRRVDKVLLLR